MPEVQYSVPFNQKCVCCNGDFETLFFISESVNDVYQCSCIKCGFNVNYVTSDYHFSIGDGDFNSKKFKMTGSKGHPFIIEAKDSDTAFKLAKMFYGDSVKFA